MKKVLVIGGATQDIFITYENPQMLQLYTKKKKKNFVILQEGSKIEIESMHYSTGGGATNCAVSFSRLGFEVSTIFKVGNDPQANNILQKLKEENVNTDHTSKDPKVHTGTSIIIPSISGDRTVLAFRGSNTQLKKEDINEELIKNFDQIYITSLSGKSSQLLPYITQLAKNHNIPVAINPGVSQLAAGATAMRKSLSNIDIFILNSDEANTFMSTLVSLDHELKKQINETYATKQSQGTPELLKSNITYQDISFSLHQFFIEILNRGPKIAVVTNGAEGVYVATKDYIYFHPSIPIKVANTLGAGDSFGSCFIASIAMGKSIEDSIIGGIINSASVISHLDTKTGLLKLEELEKKIKKITTKNIIKLPIKK